MSNLVKFEPHKSHIVYKTKDGKRCPGASTIAKIGDNPDALIHWAWNLGCEGKDYRAVRDTAANTGTLAHWLVQCYLSGEEPDLTEFAKPVIDRAETAFIHFLDFWKGEALHLHLSEHPLVSEQYRYGGTLDLIAEDDDGRVTLLDFKTSDRIYQSHLSQLAAYEMLWNEHHVERPIFRRCIVRIPKADDGNFEVRWLSHVDAYWNLFRAQLALYNAQKQCKAEGE